MQKIILGLSLLAIAFVACTNKSPSGEQATSSSAVSNLTALVALPADSLNQLDIARMNLLCAEGLLGAEQMYITDSLMVIDQMAARVRSETERHVYRFQKNPAEFENSEGFFRMMMLMVVLAEDFKVRYAPNKMANAASASMGTMSSVWTQILIGRQQTSLVPRKSRLFGIKRCMIGIEPALVPRRRCKTGLKRQMIGTQTALGRHEAGLMNLKRWIVGMETVLWDTACADSKSEVRSQERGQPGDVVTKVADRGLRMERVNAA